MRHPDARREAIRLVETYDGSANKLIEGKLDERHARGEVDNALRLDQLRREIEGVYELTGGG